MRRSFFISALVLTSLLLALASPTTSAEDEILPPDVEYNPPLRMTTLFAEGQDTLSPQLKEQPETYNHDFPAGPGSGPSDGPTLTTPSFVRDAPIGSESWNFSLWATGNGQVDIDLSLFLDGTELDQVNSGGISLSEEKQRIDFTGGNLPDNISIDQTLSIRWTVNSGTVPIFSPSDCTVYWGSSETPTNLTITAGIYQVDDPYLESEGVMFRGEHENYSRSDVIWAAQVRWALSDKLFEEGTLVLHAKDGHEEYIVEPTEDGTDSDGGVYRWEFEVWKDGTILEAHVMWNDSSGNQGNTNQAVFEMGDRGPSILSSGIKDVLFYLTIPVLVGVGFWLRGRYRSLEEKAKELGHGSREEGDLARLFLAASFLIAGINNALILYTFHTRELGASEDIVILHLCLLAFALGAFGPIWGAIADKWGHRKQLMTFAISGATLIMLSFPFLPLEAYIIASTIQVALFSAVRMGVAVGTEWFPEQKGEFLGVLYAFASFAAAIGSMVCSKLYVLLLPSGATYAMLGLVGFSIPALLLGAIMIMKFEGDDFSWPIWMLKGGEKPEPMKLSFREKLSMFRGMLRFESKWALLCLLGVILVAIPRGAVVLTALRYLEVVGFDVDFTGLLEAWAVVAVLILYAIIGKVCDDRGPQTVLFWSAVAYGTLWSIFSIGLPPMIAVLIFIVPIYPMLLVSNDALMAKFTNEDERNRGIGMASLVAFIGQSIGILAGFFALGYFISSGKSDIVAYETFYRANVPLWIIAISFTYWLTKQIGSADNVLDAEISE
ncbi:MAG: MFS transporter [Candidatus Thalassarchaeaceae archaeon]|nr:MFS transporter [Candidatus Thalassarchaeaceae archaeon]MDP7043395.1 MFS transporter [Candidatus Thalassarchaeaceae archaeon]